LWSHANLSAFQLGEGGGERGFLEYKSDLDKRRKKKSPKACTRGAASYGKKKLKESRLVEKDTCINGRKKISSGGIKIRRGPKEGRGGGANKYPYSGWAEGKGVNYLYKMWIRHHFPT